MKTSRLLALGFLAAASLVVIAQDSFLLRRTLVEGQTDTYELAMTNQQTVDASAFGGPPQEVNFDMGMKITYTTGKVDKEKNTAAVTIKVHDIETKMDGPMAQMSGMAGMPKEYSVTGTMNDRNQITDIKMEGLPAAVQAMSSQQISQMTNSISFPEGPVRVGSTWKLEMPKGLPDTGMTPNLTAKVLGEKEWEGLKAVEVEIEGPIDMKMDPSAGNPDATGGMRMMITGTVESKTTMLIEKATGRMLFSESTGTSNMKIELTDMGATLPMTGKTTVVMRLQTKK